MNVEPPATPAFLPLVAGTGAAPLSTDAGATAPDATFALLLGLAAAALAPADVASDTERPSSDDPSSAPSNGQGDPLLLLGGALVQEAALVGGPPCQAPTSRSNVAQHDAAASALPVAPAAASRTAASIAGPVGEAAAGSAPVPPRTPALQAALSAPLMTGAAASLAPLPGTDTTAAAANASAPIEAANATVASRPGLLPDRVAAPIEVSTSEVPWLAAPAGAARGPAVDANPALTEPAPLPTPAAGGTGAPAHAPTLAATAPAAAPATVSVATRAFAPGWHEEVTTKLAAVVLRGHDRAQLRLTPAELGPVEVRIDVRGSETTIAIVAPQPATRDALEQALPALREALAQQGLALGEATVRDGRPDSRHAAERSGQAGQPTAEAPSPVPLPAPSPAQRVHRLVDTFA